MGQFAAKQYNSPSPPVEMRLAWLQPRDGCAATQEFVTGGVPVPLRSEWPTMTDPSALLV
jgi:hypothetical protein